MTTDEDRPLQGPPRPDSNLFHSRRHTDRRRTSDFEISNRIGNSLIVPAV